VNTADLDSVFERIVRNLPGLPAAVSMFCSEKPCFLAKAWRIRAKICRFKELSFGRRGWG